MTAPTIDRAALSGAAGPLLFANATIHTLDPAIGDLQNADLLVSGNRIAAVGPHPLTASAAGVASPDNAADHATAGSAGSGATAADAANVTGDDGVTVVDCSGLSIVPIGGLSTLAPGSAATFAVIAVNGRNAWEYIIWRPEQAVLVMVDGTARPAPPSPAIPGEQHSPYLGLWIDESGFLHQELTADGRYDETRGGRPHAYEGNFWIDGDRIVYLDDLGFWAYGKFLDGVLHHAGYILHRATGAELP